MKRLMKRLIIKKKYQKEIKLYEIKKFQKLGKNLKCSIKLKMMQDYKFIFYLKKFM